MLYIDPMTDVVAGEEGDDRQFCGAGVRIGAPTQVSLEKTADGTQLIVPELPGR